MDAWPRKQKRRWVRPAVGATLVVGALSFLVLGAGLEWKPAWYQPIHADEAAVRRAKLASAEFAEFVGNRLVEGQPFDLVLSQTSVNEIAAAFPVLWPERMARVPKELSQPAAAFVDGVLRWGCLVDRAGWRAIVNAEVRFTIGDATDDIEVSLQDVRIGAVSVPRPMLREMLDDRLRTEAARTSRADEWTGVRGKADSVDALFRGMTLQNRFVWPNGRRPFRIDALSMEKGEARIRIRPL